ncbi:dnaJ homolog subfamily C member 16 [Glossina fuscipes]|uniref:DnaJ homolog subfamily C member 16 n=1 Tax=Glossina fuscipes TaxID=7396 RepID=A0A9C6DV26_9MUSC|nr:dnaJ homolog subfamily C member 16 [Glossina fuscipes]
MNYKQIHFALVILQIFYFGKICGEVYNPYKILGLNRHATNQEIRRAYKQLAKEWHPDKNDHPEAESNFIQIKKAFELLSDSERRHIYDQHGITDEDSYLYKQRHDYSHYKRFSSDLLEELFGKQFYFDYDVSFYHKLTITTQYYEQTIISKSKFAPYIIIFYSDWCFRCNRLVGTFKKLTEIFEPLGIEFATVNVALEQQLLRRTGATDVPSLVLVLNGHCFVYRGSSYMPHNIIEFIRKKMPYNLTPKVQDDTIVGFLSGWIDNRIRGLVIEPRNQTRLRYLIAAYAFQQRVAFGFVNANSNYCKQILQRYQVHPHLDTLLLFNEDSERPIASISMSNIPTETLNNIILSNQYLTLPRLSSQDILEGLCPAEWNRPRKRLCIILVTENSKEHNFAREALRNIARRSEFKAERVRFAYIFKEKQIDFINALSRGSSDDKLLRIVILWRRDTSRVKYEWINDITLNKRFADNQSLDRVINQTKYQIDSTIQRLLKTSEALTYEAFIKNLLDEHAQDFINRWVSKIFYVFDYIMDNIEKEHILATISLLGTIVLMFAVGYAMVYLVKAEEESLKAKGKLSSNVSLKQSRYIPELKLHELRAEKYNGMVRLLKPGCRTIVLITDLRTRPKLIPPFHKAVWPYRRTKTLIFGHMLIEKGFSWYSELLRLSLCESKNLQINPRNCVGTVLALNGHRKYFCMYHAKHPESDRGAKGMESMARQLIEKQDDPETKIFFANGRTDESDDSEPRILLEENLLEGLSNWLDRLFEGTTHRYYINYWPEFFTK